MKNELAFKIIKNHNNKLSLTTHTHIHTHKTTTRIKRTKSGAQNKNENHNIKNVFIIFFISSPSLWKSAIYATIIAAQ